MLQSTGFTLIRQPTPTVMHLTYSNETGCTAALQFNKAKIGGSVITVLPKEKASGIIRAPPAPTTYRKAKVMMLHRPWYVKLAEYMFNLSND